MAHRDWNIMPSFSNDPGHKETTALRRSSANSKSDVVAIPIEPSTTNDEEQKEDLTQKTEDCCDRCARRCAECCEECDKSFNCLLL